MPHALAAHRDAIDALIGPIEELIAKVNETLPTKGSEAYVAAFTLGGFEQAMTTLQETVSAIDEYEEPEVEAEVEEPENEFDEDEIDGDDDSDDEL